MCYKFDAWLTTFINLSFLFVWLPGALDRQEQILSSKPSLAAATSSSSAAHTPDGPNSVGNLELMKQIQERQLLLVVIYRR